MSDMPKKIRSDTEIFESIEKLLILLLIKQGLKSDDIAKVTGGGSSTIRKMYPRNRGE